MVKDKRSNKWAFLIYQESAPKNYLDILEEMHIPFILSPWHDKDVNKETGEFWSCVFWSPENILWNFLHELQHFQVLHYFKDTPPMSRLTREQFEFLKESLTVILNVECKKFMAWEDKWYPLHQDLRKNLSAFWFQEGNFKTLIAYWCDCLMKDAI